MWITLKFFSSLFGFKKYKNVLQPKTYQNIFRNQVGNSFSTWLFKTTDSLYIYHPQKTFYWELIAIFFLIIVLITPFCRLQRNGNFLINNKKIQIVKICLDFVKNFYNINFSYTIFYLNIWYYGFRRSEKQSI